MKDLNNQWITEGLIDFEYKKYVLLGYLKSCRQNFQETKLYPSLADLVRHYQNLNELNSNLEQLQNAFPKELSGFDFQKLRLEYEKQRGDDENMTTITDIIDFALPNIRYTIEEGKEIYDFVEKNIEIAPVGIVPMYNNDGYMLLHTEKSDDVHIYQYRHSVIAHTTDNLRSLSLSYLYKEVRSIANPIEQIKLSLIKKFRELPQPATYLCMSKLSFPLMETLLPVTKRLLLARVFS